MLFSVLESEWKIRYQLLLLNFNHIFENSHENVTHQNNEVSDGGFTPALTTLRILLLWELKFGENKQKVLIAELRRGCCIDKEETMCGNMAKGGQLSHWCVVKTLGEST